MIAALPPSQREVIILRDVEGWTSEVCDLLGLDGSDERALLHGARSSVRCAAEEFLQGSPSPAFAAA